MKSSRLKAHLKAAKAYAELSHAKRLQVGAVLIKEDRIVSVGYNGMPSGFPNEAEYPPPDPRNYSPKLRRDEAQPVTKPEVVHAEMNAIAFAAKYGVATDGCTMIVTHSPCFECSKLLMQSGVKKVYYETEYRLTDSLEFLKKGGIEVVKL